MNLGWNKVLLQVSSSYLYTAGYEGLAIDEFVNRLRSQCIRTVVDVRELPLSRKKGFSKNSFREHLASEEIGYVHLSALGCPKAIRDQYRIDKDWSAYTRSFVAYLASQQSSLRELAKLSRLTTVCLVCFEADYLSCHRTYVARATNQLGAPPTLHIGARTAVLDQSLRAVA